MNFSLHSYLGSLSPHIFRNLDKPQVPSGNPEGKSGGIRYATETGRVFGGTSKALKALEGTINASAVETQDPDKNKVLGDIPETNAWWNYDIDQENMGTIKLLAYLGRTNAGKDVFLMEIPKNDDNWLQSSDVGKYVLMVDWKGNADIRMHKLDSGGLKRLETNLALVDDRYPEIGKQLLHINGSNGMAKVDQDGEGYTKDAKYDTYAFKLHAPSATLHAMDEAVEKFNPNERSAPIPKTKTEETKEERPKEERPKEEERKEKTPSEKTSPPPEKSRLSLGTIDHGSWWFNLEYRAEDYSGMTVHKYLGRDDGGLDYALIWLPHENGNFIMRFRGSPIVEKKKYYGLVTETNDEPVAFLKLEAQDWDVVYGTDMRKINQFIQNRNGRFEKSSKGMKTFMSSDLLKSGSELEQKVRSKMP